MYVRGLNGPKTTNAPKRSKGTKDHKDKNYMLKKTPSFVFHGLLARLLPYFLHFFFFFCHFSATRYILAVRFHFFTLPVMLSLSFSLSRTHTYTQYRHDDNNAQVMVDLSIPGATGVFTAAEGGGQPDTLVLVSLSPLLAAANAAKPNNEGIAPAEATGHTRVLAFEEDSRVIELEEGGDGNPFVGDAATVDLCAMAGGTIVQAHAQVSFFGYSFLVTGRSTY